MPQLAGGTDCTYLPPEDMQGAARLALKTLADHPSKVHSCKQLWAALARTRPRSARCLQFLAAKTMEYIKKPGPNGRVRGGRRFPDDECEDNCRA